jgi:myo-inositol-1(or 4)-monophosphatase
MRKPVVNIAVTAARQAGQIITRALTRLDTIKVVDKDRYDFATEIDKAAEMVIIKELRRAYPEHAIHGEESGLSHKARYTWVIDPLDGTSNFMRGLPHFCVSIALLEEGVPQHAVVYDPVRDELFTASRGSGAFLNDRRMRIGQRNSLEGALLGTGFPFRQRRRLPLQLRMVRQLLEQAEDLRRTGSAALDLCYVAAGRLDGFFEFGLMPWDMAAGILLVREAGGSCVDFDGSENYFSSGNVIAANVKITAQMLGRIKPLTGLKSSVVETEI